MKNIRLITLLGLLLGFGQFALADSNDTPPEKPTVGNSDCPPPPKDDNGSRPEPPKGDKKPPSDEKGERPEPPKGDCPPPAKPDSKSSS